MKKTTKTIIQIVWVSLSIFLFTYGFLHLFFANLNGEFLYVFKKSLSEKISKEIVVIEIDDKTYNNLWYPLDRTAYIPFLDHLQASWPAVIGFDILFLDKSQDSKKDLLLANKMKQLGNVVLWFDIKNGVQVIKPYQIFTQSILSTGYFKPTVSDETNKVHSIRPIQYLLEKWKKDVYESFSFSLLRAYYNYLYLKSETKITGKPNAAYYDFFDKKVPLKSGEFFIHYTEPKNFTRESFYNVYRGNFPKDFFKDKIVLIGYTAEWVKDDFYIPWFAHLWPIKGVYIHANAINNVLNDNFIVYFNKNVELLIGFFFIVLLVYLNVFYLNLNLRWLSFGAIFLFIFVLSLYFIIFIVSYKNSGVFILPNYPFEFASILFLTFFASSVLKYVNEDKNKKLLSKALSEYVSADIAREILTSSWLVNLSWENKKITMFFSDIKGFTTLSEKMSPEELVGFLRIYLSDMSNIIMDHKGFINKYEWDAIMALWWVFGTVEKYWVLEACKSAIDQQKRLAVLNQDWIKLFWEALEVRMGIHTGSAIIGNIWAQWKKMEFTALWDSVNLASRLEGVNKFYKTHICVSEDVYEEAKEYFTFRYLDKIRVKWKNNAIGLYELVSYKDEEWDLKKQIFADFQQWLHYYLEKNFVLAQEKFLKNMQLNDGPSEIFYQRCLHYISHPPESNWDGVYSFDEK